MQIYFQAGRRSKTILLTKQLKPMEYAITYLQHNALALVVSALAVVGAFFVLRYYEKDRKLLKMDKSEYLHQVILKDHSFLLIVVLLVINFGEAVYAATIKLDEDEGINIITRFISHMGIMLASIAIMFDVPKSIVKIVSIIDANSRSSVPLSVKKKMILWGYWIRLTINIISIFIFPGIILIIIVVGNNQLQEAGWFLKDIFFDMRKVYYEHGLSPDYNIFQQIGVKFWLPFSAMCAHILIGNIDALWAAIQSLEGDYKSATTAAERANARGQTTLTDEQKRNAEANFRSIIEELVVEFGDSNRDDPTVYADDLYTKFVDLKSSNPNKASNLSIKAGQLYARMRDIDKAYAENRTTEAEFNANRIGLEDEVRKYFRSADVNRPLSR